MQASEQFAATVRSIKKLGIDPNMGLFVRGVSVMSGINLSTWERKVDVYKSLGWSEKEVISAFTKGPFCMLLSEEKIRRGMDFYVKKLQWMPSFLAANPVLLCLSLEKRVIPRCSVMNVLASKGLVGLSTNPSLKTLMISEKNFLDKYVIKYQDQVPEVRQAYNRNLGFVGRQSTVVQGSLSAVSSFAT